MNNEPTTIPIETVKKKLKKYVALKEPEKVKEYLRKLHHASVTSSLIQETKIDSLVRQLASDKTATYSSSARKLLKRWHHQRSLSKPTIETNKITIEKQSDELSESQSFDNNKQRKVLSLAQYLENKKHILSLSSTSNTKQNKLADSQIEVINAQFKATTEKLTASVPDLTNTLNKNLIEIQKKNNILNEFVVKKTTHEESKQKFIDLWAEDDDDNDSNIQSQTTESKTVNSNDSFHIQKLRQI
ncbi:unnamed protein product [Adineta steineri]|uniref:TFIIS N-terminal domain-containing protein n=1 Tax=Adineta steineri TaxID=433720 RepID=A0A816BZR5_9BILA|nr:unnamed protein product [Adineta steineri]CAF1616478.1 unnamed protein product [Adineta steineri]